LEENCPDGTDVYGLKQDPKEGKTRENGRNEEYCVNKAYIVRTILNKLVRWR
jgi:hypothetical protein